MKIVDFDWHEHFTSLILSRGRTYFAEGRVENIRRIDNTYIASVEGTEDYEVEITIEDGGIKEMLCNCPYAETDNCKHMAAVLYTLETENVNIKELPKAPQPPAVSHVPMEAHWLEAIDNLAEDIVRKELLKKADRDDRLRERLAVLYLGKLPEGQLQNWKADLQEMASKCTDRRGCISGEDVWDFTAELGDLVETKLPLLLEVNAIMDAFHMIWIVMETALEWHVEDEDGDIDDLFDDCEESLRKVYTLATEDQKTQMMQWYQENRDPEWPGGVAYVDHVFHSLTLSSVPVRGNRVVKYIDEVPCFLCEDEWVTFPKRGHLYYDFVEESPDYKEVEPIVEELIKEQLGELYDHFGACHAIWYHRKRLLMERYGIEWFTPVELNRDVLFD